MYGAADDAWHTAETSSATLCVLSFGANTFCCGNRAATCCVETPTSVQHRLPRLGSRMAIMALLRTHESQTGSQLVEVETFTRSPTAWSMQQVPPEP